MKLSGLVTADLREHAARRAIPFEHCHSGVYGIRQPDRLVTGQSFGIIARQIVTPRSGRSKAETAAAAHGHVDRKPPGVPGAGDDTMAGPDRFQIVSATAFACARFKVDFKHLVGRIQVACHTRKLMRNSAILKSRSESMSIARSAGMCTWRTRPSNTALWVMTNSGRAT